MTTIPLDERDRRELLRIARATLREHLTTGYLPPGAPHRASLLQRRGAFVTLKVDGELRGCVGRADDDKPLYLTVEELCVAAATSDARFEPLRLEELKDTRLILSVLSPLERCAPERLELGAHGLVVTRGPRRGVLLPQLAIENNWSAERFLDETCAKAGLPAGAWKQPGTDVHVFTTDVFGEED